MTATGHSTDLEALADQLGLGPKDAECALCYASGDVERMKDIVKALREMSSGTSIQSMPDTHALAEDAKKKAERARQVRQARIEREQVPPSLRIVKNAGLLSESPEALDLLLSSLCHTLLEPDLKRVQRINQNDSIFQSVVEKAPGGMELLYACGYQPEFGYLVLKKHDPGLIKRAVEELEGARASDTYKLAREKIAEENSAAMERVKEQEAARARRAAFLAMVPDEPTEEPTLFSDTRHTVSQIHIHVCGEDKIVRRFAPTDVLRDLEHFIRSLTATPDGCDLCVEDITNAFKPRELDLEQQAEETLHGLGLWPVAQVRVRTDAVSKAARVAAERRKLAKDGWVEVPNVEAWVVV